MDRRDARPHNADAGPTEEARKAGDEETVIRIPIPTPTME